MVLWVPVTLFFFLQSPPFFRSVLRLLWLLAPTVFWLPSNLYLSDILFLDCRIFICFLKNILIFLLRFPVFLFITCIFDVLLHSYESCLQNVCLPFQQLILLRLVLVALFSMGDIFLLVQLVILNTSLDIVTCCVVEILHSCVLAQPCCILPGSNRDLVCPFLSARSYGACSLPVWFRCKLWALRCMI